jgi:hypothetical protein
MIFLIDNHNTSDPHVNLALEAYALRYLDPDRSYFLMYVNQPAVIVGIGFEKIGHAAKLEKRLMGISYHLEAIRTRLSGVDVRSFGTMLTANQLVEHLCDKGISGLDPGLQSA